MKEEYKLLDDGRVQYSYENEKVDFTPEILGSKKIGQFFNTGITYIDSKEQAIELLEKQLDHTKKDLEGTRNELKAIDINDTIAEEVKDMITKLVELEKQVQDIKDFSGEDYVANNPKKFGKMLKGARLLKENIYQDIKAIDKIVSLSNKKEELIPKEKLYLEQVEKMKKQLEQVKVL